MNLTIEKPAVTFAKTLQLVVEKKISLNYLNETLSISDTLNYGVFFADALGAGAGGAIGVPWWNSASHLPFFIDHTVEW